MNRQVVKLVDGQGQIIATADVCPEGDRFGGSIDLGNTPAPVRALFDEFEEIVNGQMLSFLDGIQAKISALGVHAVIGDKKEIVEDLQVYPDQGEVSFKLVERSEAPRPLTNGLAADKLPQFEKHPTR